jgi:preprotein translocase subunit SecA
MSRLGSPALHYFYRLFGSAAQRRLARAALLIDAVRHQEALLEKESDAELKHRGLRLKGRARGGTKLDVLLPEAFGLVCVAAKRWLGLRPFDVQIAAGVVLHHGALAELATGEGKTLTASMPTFLNALTGKGVHVATVNDYLAKRDCEWMQPIYEGLGLTVGAMQMKQPDDMRYDLYRRDITYGMASEFGFDFLRDRLKQRSSGQQGAVPFWVPFTTGAATANGSLTPRDPRIQRDFHYAIVDEADSILIDEARTPLIISTGTQPASEEEAVVYRWADKLARMSRYEVHFTFDQKKQKIELTEEGRRLVRYGNPPSGPFASAMDKLFEHLERAIFAHVRYRLDQHYMVEEGKVVIIDEYTGRRMPDRHWREGIHQAVEAKEGVQITKQSDHAASITFQSYFKLYKKLAGMTGTAHPNEREFARVYKLPVVVIPTNKPVIRVQEPDLVFPTEDAKYDAVVEHIQKVIQQGRSVLVGTRSVEKSEKLAGKLRAAGIPHQVLNARQHELEAQIVQQAGRASTVTIATNMAGRGTDIKLDPDVQQAGGLCVIGTERHDARRIDRQLAGRCGRQGDPGSCQFFLSLEDELLEALGPARQQALLALRDRKNVNWNRFRQLFLEAQRRTENRHYKQRVDLMVYEKQRQEVLKELGADPYVD